MTEKLDRYKVAKAHIPLFQRVWPLYGAGFENLGKDGQMIDVRAPHAGPDELLVRHDAVGLCFSDTKVIRLGEDHPRIYRDMRKEPVVLGHEVCMTVVEVGENLRNEYKAGDRFIIQADIFVNGVGFAYGYEIQGGLSQYNILDGRILNGDDGNYLIPVQPSTGYAESALTEPWACVIAAYQLRYRTALKPGGVTWILGTPESRERAYTISAGLEKDTHPSRLLLTRVPLALDTWLRERAACLGIEVFDVPDAANPPLESIDDMIILGADAELVETVSPRLANAGVLAILADHPMTRKVSLDIGRVHYNRWLYVGSTGVDVAEAYMCTPVRSELKPGGRVWFVGAGGPMGRMHIQRALQMKNGPAEILCTDVSDLRLDDLCDSFSAEAQAKGIGWTCLNPMNKDAYAAGQAKFRDAGFDDIIVLAPIPSVISEAGEYLAPGGVMNVFAGLNRGVMASLDLGDVYLKNARIIGHSASSIDDLRLMLHQAESGELSPNRSVAALGSLSAARDGLMAVRDSTFPGKVVIYPQINEFPLTALPDLKEKLPSVYALLKDGHEWTNEAEEEFLRLMLP